MYFLLNMIWHAAVFEAAIPVFLVTSLDIACSFTGQLKKQISNCQVPQPGACFPSPRGVLTHFHDPYFLDLFPRLLLILWLDKIWASQSKVWISPYLCHMWSSLCLQIQLGCKMPVDPIAHWWGKYAEKLQIVSTLLSHGCIAHR